MKCLWDEESVRKKEDLQHILALFSRCPKVRNAYFRVANITEAVLTLALHMLTLVC